VHKAAQNRATYLRHLWAALCSKGKIMSEEVLKLIPEDKNYIPDEGKAEEARVLLEDFFPDGEQAEIKYSDQLMFIDGGENTVKIGCPLCNSVNDLSEDTNAEWWNKLDTQTSSDDANIETFEVEMPCCNKPTLIQKINYFGSAGFAKFELCIWNPYADDGISEQQIKQLESLLGCKLIEIWAHY
jgi:hypothetical protein